ncbi:CYTH domain-containing protein [Peribacillus sp. SCS-37]|uniref:CYTH domain-containing protein n=1 Tax=Paraperibacillus esterisolvens TaxID=3115296 RepID=UPI003906CBA1
MQEIEIEYKNLLTREEFEAAAKKFNISPYDFKTQINYYFDTADFKLKDEKCALRIRNKNGLFTLTLKEPAAEGLLETHQALTGEEAGAILEGGSIPAGPVRMQAERFGIDMGNIELFGALETDRCEFRYKDGLLVFDNSRYLGKEDFELEYEVKDAESGRRNFYHLLKELNIPVRHAENKVKRFYDAKFNG